jgi:3-dehydroquinate synthase
LVYRSVDIKNNIVVEDPQEKGIRKALNFGHTIGHAVETYSLENDERSLTHGEAIAIGMICENYTA